MSRPPPGAMYKPITGEKPFMHGVRVVLNILYTAVAQKKSSVQFAFSVCHKNNKKTLFTAGSGKWGMLHRRKKLVPQSKLSFFFYGYIYICEEKKVR